MVKSLKNGVYRAVFFLEVCNRCPFRDVCRSERCGRMNRQFKYRKSDLRSVERRKREATEDFQREYGKKRIPIEGLNGRLKQFTLNFSQKSQFQKFWLLFVKNLFFAHQNHF